MKLTFLGTGPTKRVTTGDGRTRSSLYVQSENFSFIIDCSLDFLEQVKRENIKKIDFIIQTHAHKDAMGGLANQLKEWIKENNDGFIVPMPVYVEKEAWDKIKERIENVDHIEPRFFTPYAPFTARGNPKMLLNSQKEGIKIFPFRLTHSIQPGFPTNGFRFNDIVYSEDVGEIPEKSERYYKNADTIIFDAAMWFDRFIKGHYNVEMSLEEAKKYKPRLFILTQAGHTYPPQETAEKKIQEYWEKVRNDVKTTVKLAYDGLSIESKSNISINLTQEYDGIYLVRPHGNMIWEGKKTLIIKSRLFRNAIGKNYYLLEGNLAYGIIKIKPPYKISLKEFEDLKDKHMITNEERKKWWPNKLVLFAYPFEIVEKFDYPRKVEVPKGAQTFVKDFKFLEQELIEDIESYNPEKIQTDILKDDWRIVMAWYSTKKKGKTMKFTYDEIEYLAKKIYNELKKRGIEFHPEKMTPNARDLFNKIANKEDKMEKSDEKQNKFDLNGYKLLEDFKDMTIIKDFISIIGSYAEQRANHTPNDIDILVRMSKPQEFIRRAVEVRILKHLGWPKEWQNKIHFVWGDPEGPHDTYIPMYDLVLKRQSPMKKIEMLDKNTKWVNPEEYKEFNIDFYPMKPSKRFYDINEALKYMFSVANKFAIEKKYNGFRGILEKSGSNIKIYSDQKRDISRNFKTIISQTDNLSSKDVILDGELVLKGGGRAEIAKFVTGKQDLDDSEIEFHAFDVIKLDKDVSEMPWHERKSLLHSLNFTKNIKEVRSVIVFKPDHARKAINLTRNLPKSEGAMIKIYDGKYTKGEKASAKSGAWIKFRNEDPINVIILEVIPKENGYTYKIGINVSKDKDKFKQDYLLDDILVLGDTFVTKQKFEKGDKITVNVEEVWRHSYPDDKIRYSIHKPSVIGTAKDISSWEYLDDLAVSKGEEVIEHIEMDEKEKCVEFFSKWSQDMAYVLGYITCDAHIYDDKNRIEFTSKDRDLLKLIQNKLGLQDEEIREVKGELSSYYVLKHVSLPLAERLKELGFKHYKQDRDTYKKVPEEYINDYIRGVADADGTYDDERNKLQIDTPNKGLAMFIFKNLKKVGGDGVHLYKYAKDMRKIAVTSNTEDVIKWIYKGGKSFLKRKKKEAIKIHTGETTTATPGVSKVQGIKWIKRKLPIQKMKFGQELLSLDDLKDLIKNEAKRYYAIKEGEEKGSLENTVLIGRIAYNEIIRRGSSFELPSEFKDYMDIIKKGETGIMQKIVEEPRFEIAEKFWMANWQNMYPKDGKGKFVYHHHWRGLNEDEIKMTDEELLNTDHSIHGDLRFEINPRDLFGFTVFTGTAKDNKEHSGDKLIYESEHKESKSKLQGGFKLEIPHSWLDIGKTKQGTVSTPRGVGATAKKYAKFFAIDWGDYDMGVARKHMREIFFKGNRLKGRAIIAYAPVGEGGRKWLIDFPVDQTPYADSHKLEDIIKELKQKKQKWLIWAKPNEKPKKIDVEKWQEEEKQDK